MEFGLITIVAIAIIIVWYFGGTLNKLVTKFDHIVDNSAEMATDEFNYLRAEQKVRIAKQYNSLGAQVESMDLKHNKNTIEKMLNAMEK